MHNYKVEDLDKYNRNLNNRLFRLCNEILDDDSLNNKEINQAKKDYVDSIYLLEKMNGTYKEKIGLYNNACRKLINEYENCICVNNITFTKRKRNYL